MIFENIFKFPSVSRVTKNAISQRHLKDYKCISLTNKSVYYTPPKPYKEFPQDVKILADDLLKKVWYNIICINYNHRNQCYCGKNFQGQNCISGNINV